jgi:hypothetical protein
MHHDATGGDDAPLCNAHTWEDYEAGTDPASGFDSKRLRNVSNGATIRTSDFICRGQKGNTQRDLNPLSEPHPLASVEIALVVHQTAIANFNAVRPEVGAIADNGLAGDPKAHRKTRARRHELIREYDCRLLNNTKRRFDIRLR